MSPLFFLRVLAIIVFCTWQAALDADAIDERPPASWGRDSSYGFRFPVRAESYISPLGGYSLHMDPAHRWGQYSAVYRLLSKGKLLWEGERPYTLREIVVTDRGFTVGFAYSLLEEQSHGPPDQDDRSYHNPDYFCVVIIDRHGKELLKDAMIRCVPPMFDSAYPGVEPHPFATQLIVDAENDRIVVQVVEWAHGCEDPWRILPAKFIWRVYSLSTGRPLARFNQDDLVGWQHNPKPSDQKCVVETTPVRGMPLLLIHAIFKTRKPPSWGARFVLIDYTGERVWSLEVPDDYTALGDCGGGYSFSECHFRRNPAILRTQAPGRFDLRFFAENKRATFTVKRDKDGKWKVSEISRADYKE